MTRRFIVLLAVFALVAAACGDDDAGSDPTTASGATTTAAASTTAATTAAASTTAAPATTAAASTTTTAAATTTAAEPVHLGAFLWATHVNNGTVYKIDHVSGDIVGQVVLSPGGGIGGGIALGGGAVWVGGVDGELVRLDPTTLEVAAVIPLSATGLGGISYNHVSGVVFASAFADDTVYVVDAGTNEVVLEIDAPGGPTGHTAGGQVVFTTFTGGRLYSFGHDGAGLIWDVDLGGSGSDVTVGGDGNVYATASDTGEVVVVGGDGTVVGRHDVGANANVVDWGFGYAWVTNSQDSSVWKVDRAGSEVATLIPTPVGIVTDDPDFHAIRQTGRGHVYVASHEFGRIYKFPASDPNAMSDLTDLGSPGAFELAFGSGA